MDLPVHLAPGLITLIGSCRIVLGVAGPNSESYHSAGLVPDDVRGMAAWVLRQCVYDAGGIGGFVTKGLSSSLDYIIDPRTDFSLPYRKKIPRCTVLLEMFTDSGLDSEASLTDFITVTVDSPVEDIENPGDYDPAVGAVLFNGIYAQYRRTPNSHYAAAVSRLGISWLLMERGGYNTWWYPYHNGGAPLDEMTYECDSNLGNPRKADCSRLEYSQLGNPSDSITVGPGEVSFFHSSTCNIAIAAMTTIVVTWEQITTAVKELIEICVNSPVSSSIGGRAFAGIQSALSIGRGQKMKRDVTSLNALPLAVNITLFQQLENFPNATEELSTCTWQHILDGRDVRSCSKARHDFLPPRPVANPIPTLPP